MWNRHNGKREHYTNRSAEPEEKHGCATHRALQPDGNSHENGNVHHLIAADIEPLAQTRLFERRTRQVTVNAVDKRRELEEKSAIEAQPLGKKTGRDQSHEHRDEGHLVGGHRSTHENFGQVTAEGAVEVPVDQAVARCGKRGPKSLSSPEGLLTITNDLGELPGLDSRRWTEHGAQRPRDPLGKRNWKKFTATAN